MEEIKQESIQEENIEVKELGKEENWLKAEEESIQTPDGDFERLPSPVFEEGKITTLAIDATKEFRKWTDPETKKVKALIPCTDNEGKKIFWCNKKNPVYREIIHKCREAENKANVIVKIMQTGTKAMTRYNLVKE